MTQQTKRPKVGKRKDAKKIKVVRGMIYVVGAAAALTALLLMILPAFCVKTIEVAGNQSYSAEEVIEASGIMKGEETLLLLPRIKSNEVGNAISSGCPKITSVTIGLKSLNKIEISVTEAE